MISIANEFTKHTKRNLKVAKTAKVEVVKGLRADEYHENQKRESQNKSI